MGFRRGGEATSSFETRKWKGNFFKKIFYAVVFAIKLQVTISKGILYYCKIITVLLYKNITVDTAEGQDAVRDNRILSSKQCEICDFYCFKNRNFNYQPHIFDECHVITTRSESLDDIKIVTANSETYRVIARNISNDRIIYLLEINDLRKKSEFLQDFL